MKLQHIFMLIACLLLVSDVACGATLHGKIYDVNLNELNNVLVEVNSTPRQRFLSKEGSYNFELAPGAYEIGASYSPDGERLYNTTEELTITAEGDYTYDLFVLPDVQEEEELNDQEILLTPDLPNEQQQTPTTLIIVGIIAFILLVIVTIKLLRKKKEKTQTRTTKAKPETERKEKRQEPTPPKEEEPAKKEETTEDYLAKIIEIMEKEGGRTTQKELRKQIPFSEAKISLMISELEHKGIVEKIKKGRGNIIILKK